MKRTLPSPKRLLWAAPVAHRVRVPGNANVTPVAIVAADNHGPGVPRRVQRRLFRPFTRGNQTDAPAGIGLGLVLVKALVRAQGGTVTYRDAAGGGAEFTVTLAR